MMRSKGLTTSVVALAMLVVAGCGQESEPMFAVIDHTGSSAAGSPELCRDHLIEFADRRYVGFLSDPGEVRADLFDSSTVAAPVFPVKVPFEVASEKQSSKRQSEEDLAEDLEDLRAGLDDLVADGGPSFGGTDVVTMLSSLGEAAHGDGGKLIWVCSDLRDHRLPDRFGTADVDLLIERVRDNGALPDLDGLEVIVDTVTVKGRTDLTSRDTAALKHFATELVRASGGTLVSYGPSPGPGA